MIIIEAIEIIRLIIAVILWLSERVIGNTCWQIRKGRWALILYQKTAADKRSLATGDDLISSLPKGLVSRRIMSIEHHHVKSDFRESTRYKSIIVMIVVSRRQHYLEVV